MKILDTQLHRALLDNIPDMAWMKDRECRYLAVNPAYLQVIGMSEGEIIGKTATEIWPAEIAEVYLLTDRSVLKSGRRRRYEEARRDPDGVDRWFETIKSPIRDSSGHIIGTVGISRDISERKAVEDEIVASRAQLRALSHYLQTVREEERARIARELHDELGQVLTAMKLDLGWLRERISSQEDAMQSRFGRLIGLVDHAVADLQRISSDLRPLILDELGLVAAIQWLTDSMASRSDLDIRLECERNDIACDSEVGTAAFRIAQEALTNVIRHSGAQVVRLSVRQSEDALHVEISDDGCGVGGGAVDGQSNHGLLGMRERALMVGGSVTIENRAAGGTRVSACLPLRPEGTLRRPDR